MQLDFLTKLIARISAPPPSAPQEPKNQPKRATKTSSAVALPDLNPFAKELFRSIGCDDLAARVQVRWNPRMRSTAGMAYPGKALVTLNPHLLKFGEAEVDRTLRHELGHLLAHHRAGQRRIAPHGPEWRRACADLGLPDESRCHTLPLPRRQVARPHVYHCPGCAVVIRRTRPLKRKVACLACCRKHSGGKYDERFRLVRATA